MNRKDLLKKIGVVPALKRSEGKALGIENIYGKDANRGMSRQLFQCCGGAWVAQSVKCRTLDLSSDLDLRVVSSSPRLGSTLGMEPTLFFF